MKTTEETNELLRILGEQLRCANHNLLIILSDGILTESCYNLLDDQRAKLRSMIIDVSDVLIDNYK